MLQTRQAEWRECEERMTDNERTGGRGEGRGMSWVKGSSLGKGWVLPRLGLSGNVMEFEG
eukprot:296027-Hanusia_phi.AAC.1